MNTEHTNQSRQAEPATHSPIALQSIPKRQRDFTAENIRDIAHECMRIGDNEQAEVIFAIADALRDGNLTIHPAAVAVRIRELEAQLNAATHARQEAQQIAQEAIEARNRAGVEIRRPLLKRIRELQAQQAEPVNQQLLALVKSFGHKTGCAKNAFGELCTCGADEAIAAAEQVTLCASCARANVDCPIYPQQTASCVEHRPAAQQQAGAVPDGSVPVPLGFLQAFHTLAHNYSLQVQAPDHYAGTERDAFSDAYARCGSELAKLRAMLAAAPQAAVPDEVAKDAARYRWLRQDESEFSSMAPTELDAAIDKAIATAQKGGAV